jgi:hypothetical protein
VITLEAVERALGEVAPPAADDARERLLALAERVLETWIEARGEVPTREAREGFRLLALHRQGAHGMPSFNACRETCREIAYHYNLLAAGGVAGRDQAAGMMTLLVRHLALFVAGKLEDARLGDFCCAAKPLREGASTMEHDPHAGEENA